MEELLAGRVAAFGFLAVLEVLFEVLHEDALHAALVAGHFNRKDNIDETLVERVDLGAHFADTAVHGTASGLAVKPVEYTGPAEEGRAAGALEAVGEVG